MIYLLDSNAWIAYLRQSHVGLAAKLKSHDSSDLALCSVVLSELYYGVERSVAHKQVSNRQLVESLRAEFKSLPFDDAAAEQAGAIRASLATIGIPIGPNDLMIAAIALANGLTLVTHNTAEFSRVPGLLSEDWQSA